MKILWFTLTPCGAAEQLRVGSQGGGWLSSLEKHLKVTAKVDLHICFQWDLDMPSFSLGGTTYHPIRRDRMKDKIVRKISGGVFQHSSTQSYANVIAQIKPDIIHVHGTEEDFGMVQAITDIPVVVSIQGILTNYLAKYFSGISFARLIVNENIFTHLKLKSIFSNYLIFRNNARRERHIFAMAKHVIGRTAWDRRSAAVLAPDAIYYHGDEIMRTPFFEGAWSRKNFSTPIRIVTVSSIALYKGFETILKVSRILHECIDFDFTWAVIGLSPDDAAVKIASKWLGTNQKIQLLGTLPGKEVCDILLDSDIYCQVSHIENSPNSLCEAMLLGMPVVASFAGGTDSLLCAGKEGILVQDGDPWSMAGAILELSRDFDQAAKMGCAARVHAQHRHNPGKIVNDLLSVYRQVTHQDSP